MKTSGKLLTILFALFVVLSGCSDDDGTGIDSNLFGQWTLEQITLRDCANANDNSVTDVSCTAQNCRQIEIGDDERYQIVNIERGITETENGQIQINPTQINLLPDNSTGNTVYEYTVTATTLTLTRANVICTEVRTYSKN